MLNSLYYKALNYKNFVSFKPDKDTSSFLEGRWFDMPFAKSREDFSIAAGDGSFNKKKFLEFNFCPVGAESLIFDGELKQFEQSEIFNIDHINFLDELLANYMSIFELKCCLKSIVQYNVDYYLFDGSIFGDLQNPYPMGAKLPDDIKNDFNRGILNHLIENINDLSSLDLSFPDIKKVFAHVNDNNDEDYNLHLSAIEKLLVLKEILKYNKRIISISKTSSSNDIFNSNVPDIALFDKYTNKSGISKICYKTVKRNFPVANDFFNKLVFTIFYLRLNNNKSVLKVELPYYATEEEVIKIVEAINRDLAGGYPYLLKKAHNDVVITNKDVEELLKIGKVYETTNREQLRM